MKTRILSTLESGVAAMRTVLLGGMCMLVQFNLIFFNFKLFFMKKIVLKK